MWTLFWDMHSGGGLKEGSYDKIYIEASEEEAKVIFYNRFGHNPERVSCTCCGDDYSISESETLEQASAYHRNCRYAYFNKKGDEVSPTNRFAAPKGTKGRYVEEGDLTRTWAEYTTLQEYTQRANVLVVRAGEIKPEERKGEVPEQGYVYV